ncbi:Ankyrin repeat domain containing protein [Pandoravirus salinus]|uniref:Ankyrin repeat domain containing protein n=1 Tax=Pandoravirus salinus TaxID=1349410 RepID=S4VV59_9VIRU|nr:ankyrin repeat domain [Pandoravirus salinus]AGO84464.1 Ankyrin repeat domain containing protein [Pandoravirus salinus]
MDQRGRDESAPIMLAPPEIVSCVLDLVSDHDFCAARKAHRVFWVTSDRVVERRREALWLRTSPERACAAGRTDVVEFLWRRKRIPRTFDMWQAAFVTPDPVLVEIAREQDPSEAKLDSVRNIAIAKDASDLFFQLFDPFGATAGEVIDAAICSHATRIFTSLIDVATHGRPRHWARLAAEQGYIDGLWILLDRYPWISLGSIVNTAAAHVRSLVEILCLVHEKDPLFPWQCVFLEIVRSGSGRAIEFVCCRMVPPRLHLQRALAEAARRGRADIVELLCRQPSARDVDLQPAVYEAIWHDRANVVESLCRQSFARNIDLRKALLAAAKYGRRGIVEFLCRQPTASDVDLQAALVSAAKYGRRDTVDFLGRHRPSLALQEAADAADSAMGGEALWAVLDLYDARIDPQAHVFCPEQPPLSLRMPLERASAEDNFRRVVDIICRADDGQIDLEAALAVSASRRVTAFLAKRMPARDAPQAGPISFDRWQFAIG